MRFVQLFCGMDKGRRFRGLLGGDFYQFVLRSLLLPLLSYKSLYLDLYKDPILEMKYIAIAKRKPWTWVMTPIRAYSITTQECQLN